MASLSEAVSSRANSMCGMYSRRVVDCWRISRTVFGNLVNCLAIEKRRRASNRLARFQVPCFLKFGEESLALFLF